MARKRGTKSARLQATNGSQGKSRRPAKSLDLSGDESLDRRRRRPRTSTIVDPDLPEVLESE